MKLLSIWVISAALMTSSLSLYADEPEHVSQTLIAKDNPVTFDDLPIAETKAALHQQLVDTLSLSDAQADQVSLVIDNTVATVKSIYDKYGASPGQLPESFSVAYDLADDMKDVYATTKQTLAEILSSEQMTKLKELTSVVFDQVMAEWKEQQ